VDDIRKEQPPLPQGKGFFMKLKGLIARGHRRIDIFMGYASACVVLVIMVFVSTDVVGRYFFNHPIPGTFEFSEVLLALIIFLALPYVQYLKANIAIRILSDRYPPRASKIFNIFCLLLGTVTFGLIAIQGMALFISSWQVREISEGTIPFPIYPFKIFVPIGFGLLFLRMAIQLLEAFGFSYEEGKNRESH
jgi:TRAP-type C4-dicarboxylate transport system permease small subunit